MIKIALLGYGTIGSGVAEVLDINHDSIAVKAGQEIEIKYILDLIFREIKMKARLFMIMK